MGMDLLADYITAKVAVKNGIKEKLLEYNGSKSVVQIALGVIKNRNYDKDKDIQKIGNTETVELKSTYLYDADLSSGLLKNVNFNHANLSSANFTKNPTTPERITDLSEASFIEANLTEAKLSDSNVTGAKFDLANFSRVDLSEVQNLTTDQIHKTCYWNAKSYNKNPNKEGRVMEYTNSDTKHQKKCAKKWEVPEQTTLAPAKKRNKKPNNR